MRFSKSSQCFYPSGIHYPSLPTDIVDCAESDYDRAVSRASGETLDFVNGSVVIVPAPQKTLAQAKSDKIDALSTSCAAGITSGVVSSALGAPYTYGSSLTDQANLTANVLSSLIPGLPAGWTTQQLCADAGGAWAYRAHTAAQIQQVGTDAKSAILALLVRKETLVSQVNAAPDVSTVDAITW